MQARNEQAGQLFGVFRWKAKTESYANLVDLAKIIVEENSEAEIFSVVSEDIELFNLFFVQMLNMKEVLEIFPSHKDVICKMLLEKLEILHAMNTKNQDQQKSAYKFYHDIRNNNELLEQLLINNTFLHKLGYYRFLNLLENVVKNFPLFNMAICDQLLKGNWFIDGLSENGLIRLLAKVFLNYPNCKNNILGRYIEKFNKLLGNSSNVSNFHMDARELFNACLSNAISNNNHGNYANDKTIQLICNLFDLCLEKVKKSTFSLNSMIKVKSEIIEDHPRIKSFAEIRKAARLLGQDKSLSFFAKYSDEILVQIASHAKNPNVHTETEANKIAYEYFGHSGLI